MESGPSSRFRQNPGVMDVLTAEQMRTADRRTIEHAGIPARVLMENAGREVARVVADVAAAHQEGDGRILVLCGPGGNGGDGLVALRTLAGRGLRATGLVLAPLDRLGPETLANLETARRCALDVHTAPDEWSWGRALRDGPLTGTRPSVVVDAILGTGVTRPIEGFLGEVLADLDSHPAFVDARHVAVDVPTGLMTDSGELPTTVFRADVTVALATPKPCHFVFPASAVCGEVSVVEIGIPRVWLSAGPTGLRTVGAMDAAALLPRRSRDAHKGEMGRMLLLAGSARMPGAAALAARGALSAGVGLLTVAGPAGALDGLPPEAMRFPVAANPDGEVDPEAVAELTGFVRSSRTDAIAVGPGIGRSEGARDAVRRFVAGTRAPLVLDADGLNAFAGCPEELRSHRRLALTPHAGEAARLLGEEVAGQDRLANARRLAAVTQAVVAYKGPGTLVAEPGGGVYVNLSGGPELATGGSGDVLTGVVGALLARRLAPREALTTAVFVHGRAGELARSRLGVEAVTASAVATEVAEVVRMLARERGR